MNAVSVGISNSDTTPRGLSKMGNPGVAMIYNKVKDHSVKIVFDTSIL